MKNKLYMAALTGLLFLSACAAPDVLAKDTDLQQIDGQISFSAPVTWRSLPIKSEAVLSHAPDHQTRQWRFIEGEDSRTPLSVTMTLATESRQLDGAVQRGDALYTLINLTEDGIVGSGGAEYRLTAVRPIGPEWLEVLAYQQVEGPPPTFASVWGVIDSAQWTSEAAPE